MKAMFKKFLSVFLTITLVLGSTAIGFSGIDFDSLFSVKAEAEEAYNVGKIFTFGSYPQTKILDEALVSELEKLTPDERDDVSYEGNKYRKYTTDFYLYEPIRWRVISAADGSVEVLAESVLDQHVYDEASDEEFEAVAWENCSLRERLNNDFYNAAFTPEEQAKILDTELDNNRGENDAYTGPNTTDKIYIPSRYDMDEAHGLGTKEERQKKATDFASAKEIYIDEDGYSSWFLRSRSDAFYADYVYWDGFVYYDSDFYHYYIDDAHIGVAPALKLKLSSSAHPTPAVPTIGDVDTDGSVTAADARLALRAAVGLETLTADQFSAANVDKDEKITAEDARFILRAAVNLEKLPKTGGDVQTGDIRADKFFSPAKMFSYNKGASVPEYKVEAGLRNVINKDQFSFLSDDAKKLLEKNGFVVIDSCSWGDSEFFWQYQSNRTSGIPSFITTDSAVHSFHLMYDYILKDTERKALTLCLKSLTESMAEKSYAQYLELKGTEFENAALRNLAYFTVAGKLLDEKFSIKDEAKKLVEEELALIEDHDGIYSSPLINFGQTFQDIKDCYMEDYTQYIPRGHYTQSEELEAYFKASMWYGRMTFRSKFPDEARSALLMTSALKDGEEFGSWNKIFSTINFFVGECADITPIDYIDVLSDIYGDSLWPLKTLTDSGNFEKAFEAIKKLPPPKVNSMFSYDKTIEPDKDSAITGLRFLGQRFTIDADIFQRLIHDETCMRYLPNALDIPAAFGSDEAYEILKNDFNTDDYPDYDGNLKEARDYISGVSDEIWTSNLYWSWLNMLRPLTKNKTDEGCPFFMRNAAWTRKQLNAFLGSWTELKHDTMLYTSQAGGGMGDGGAFDVFDDRGYVEPEPELFGRLEALVAQTKTGLENADLITEEIAAALDSLYEISVKLKEISIKELENKEITDEEYEFIRFYGDTLERIWRTAKKDEIKGSYNDFEPSYVDLMVYLEEHPCAVIADVATDPNSGNALEEATGYVKDIVVAFPRDGKVVLGEGSVYSHYEFAVPIANRMTDDDWHSLLKESRPKKDKIPDAAGWTKDFTAAE